MLDGRDSDILKELLKHHKKITLVARDRTSAYAKAINAILPDCIQVADRFHLLQNLIERMRDIFKAEIFNDISYDVSCGFVEGNNNKFKLIKRILYGREDLINLFKKSYIAFQSKLDKFKLLQLTQATDLSDSSQTELACQALRNSLFHI